MDAMVERERRSKAIRAGGDRQHERTDTGSWVGQPAAIYCRISKVNDDDQTGVDRQERLCREVADRLGLVVRADAVFVDPNRSAWQRNRKRSTSYWTGTWHCCTAVNTLASRTSTRPRGTSVLSWAI
jgi:site-specific DNA recombinase